jgi:hypothetical protein
LIRKSYRRQHSPLLGRRIAHNIICSVPLRIPAAAEEKAAADLLERNVVVARAQERERGVDQRWTSPIQITKIEIIDVLVEEPRQGLWRPLADVRGGAESKPRLGHALEAAERPVGHSRKDLDEGALGEARRGLLPLHLLFLHIL